MLFYDVTRRCVLLDERFRKPFLSHLKVQIFFKRSEGETDIVYRNVRNYLPINAVETSNHVLYLLNCTASFSCFFFFLTLSLLIGLHLSICNCCKPFLSLLYNCQLLCYWRLALNIAVQVFPLPLFPKYCSFKDVYYKLVMPNCMPYP